MKRKKGVQRGDKRISAILSPSKNLQGCQYRNFSPPQASLHLLINDFLPSTSYMPGTRSPVPYTCARCLRAVQRQHALPIVSGSATRSFSKLSPLRSSESSSKIGKKEDENSIQAKILDPNPTSPRNTEAEQGAMSRRLAEATEDALLEGGRAGRKAVEEAGFSEELKEKLLEKVAAHKFRSENATAFAEAGMTSNVGRGPREIATGQAWTGTEATEDTVLRMLDDARKPLKPGLRGSSKIPSPIIDLRLKREPKLKPGDRLANARDRTSIYAISKDTQMSEKEREDMRKELKERFTPGARAMPNSIRGLAALANERIEDAIARGQFKVGNCPWIFCRLLMYSPEHTSRQSH